MKEIGRRIWNNPTLIAGAAQAGNAAWAAEGHPPLAVTIAVAVLVALGNRQVVRPVNRK